MALGCGQPRTRSTVYSPTGVFVTRTRTRSSGRGSGRRSVRRALMTLMLMTRRRRRRRRTRRTRRTVMAMAWLRGTTRACSPSTSLPLSRWSTRLPWIRLICNCAKRVRTFIPCSPRRTCTTAARRTFSVTRNPLLPRHGQRAPSPVCLSCAITPSHASGRSLRTLLGTTWQMLRSPLGIHLVRC